MRLGLGLSLTGMPAGDSASYDAVTALGSDLFEGWEAWRAGTVTQVGGLVSAWAGIKTGAQVTQGTGGLQPVFSANGFNGGPVLTFDGIDDYLALANPSFPPTGSTPCEIWALVDSTAVAAATATGVIGGYGAGTGSGPATGRYVTRSVLNGVSRGGVSVGSSTATLSSVRDETVVFEGRHIVRAQIGAAQTVLTIDGSSPTAPLEVVPGSVATMLRIGAHPTPAVPTNPFKGGIAAIYFTAPLSAAKANALRADLLQRKGS